MWVGVVWIAIGSSEVDGRCHTKLPAWRQELREPRFLPLSERFEDKVAGAFFVNKLESGKVWLQRSMIKTGEKQNVVQSRSFFSLWPTSNDAVDDSQHRKKQQLQL